MPLPRQLPRCSQLLSPCLVLHYRHRSHLGVFPVWLHSIPCETSLSSSQETVDMESEDHFTPFIQCRVAQISRECARTEARPTQVPWPESEAQAPTSCASALSRHSGLTDDNSGCHWLSNPQEMKAVEIPGNGGPRVILQVRELYLIPP